MNLTTTPRASSAGVMYHARTRSPAPPENSTSDTSNGAYRPGSWAVIATGRARSRASRSRAAHQRSSPSGSCVLVRYSRSRSSGKSYQGIQATLALRDLQMLYLERPVVTAPGLERTQRRVLVRVAGEGRRPGWTIPIKRMIVYGD